VPQRMVGAASDKDKSLRTFGMGSFSGAVSALVLQPFDVVKTRQQGVHRASTIASRVPASKAVRDILAQDGARGLWRGMVPSVVRASLGPGLYFVALEQFQGSRSRASHQDNKSRVFLEGAVARGLAGLALCPLTVVKTRLEWARGKNAGAIETLAKIAREERLAGLFRGAIPTLIRDAPASGIYLMFFQGIFQPWAFKTLGDVIPSAVLNISCAVAAGFLGSLVTHPADVVKTHVQINNGTVRDGIKTIWELRGGSGFFSGFTARMVRRPMSMAITWTIFELVRRKEFDYSDAGSAKRL